MAWRITNKGQLDSVNFRFRATMPTRCPQLTERRVAIALSAEARAWLAKKGYDRVYGARPLARVIQTEVRDKLTDEILFGRLEGGGTVGIGLDGDKLAFEFRPAVVPA